MDKDETIKQLQAELQKAREERQKLEEEVKELKKSQTTSDDTNNKSESTSPDSKLRIRVLDLSRVLAGPFCSMILADMGADVIKLEVPGLGDDSRQFPPFSSQPTMSYYYVNFNRGKRSITLNLKDKKGVKIFLDLVKHADVVLENFSPGTMGRLGLSYEELSKVNPKLIFASISGFGQTGSLASRPGYDIIAQAMSGLMSITGWEDSPPTRAGTAVGDVMAALFTSVGILSALEISRKTGKGQHIDVSLVDSLFASVGQHLQLLFQQNKEVTRIGNRYEFIYPYDSFKAKDGWVILGIANDKIWGDFKKFVEIKNPDFWEKINIEKFSTNKSRLQHFQELKELMNSWTGNYEVNWLCEALNDIRVPSCPINTIRDVVNDERISKQREMIAEIDQPGLGKVKVSGNPLKMSETHPYPSGPAPQLGEHTQEILLELLGIEQKEFEELKKDGVV